MKLDKLSAETFGQMIDSESISSNFTEKLTSKIKEVGMTAILTTIMIVSSGVAHAGPNDVRDVMLGMSAVTGVLANGTVTVNGQKVDCAEAAKNGWKIGGGVALGTVIGNQMGNGKGKEAMTVIGGVLGGAIANNSEENRIKAECTNKLNQQANLNNGIPSYASTTNYVDSPILYEGMTYNNRSYFVTIKNSPGFAALRDNSKAVYKVEDNPQIKQILDERAGMLVVAHNKLEEATKLYTQSLGIGVDTPTVAKLTQGGNGSYGNMQKIMYAQNEVDKAYVIYAERRARFSNSLDIVATDRFDVTGYADMIPVFTPPTSLSVRYDGGKIPNKYATLRP